LLKKTVKKALSYLQTSYNNGLILYPRVDNNLVYEKTFDLFPHPELLRFSKKMEPMDFNVFKINKRNSLLFLSITRTLTPSNIESISESIDDVFDEELIVKPEKIDYFDSIMNTKNIFFKNNKITNKSVSDSLLSAYEDIQNQPLLLIKTNDMFFLSERTPLLVSCQKQSKKDNKKIKSVEVEKIEDAVRLWEKFESSKFGMQNEELLSLSIK